MATNVKAEAGQHEFYMLFGLDFGTSKISVAVEIRRTDNDELALPPFNLCFVLDDCMSGYEMPAIGTWVNGLFIHGFKLQKLESRDHTISAQVLDFVKLCLYDSEETQVHIQKAEELLKRFPGKTIDSFLKEYLEAIIRDCRAAMQDQDLQFNFTKQQLANMPFRVRISVPQMWTPAARRRMQIAAKSAGFPLVTLASEPHCALAFLVHRELAKGKSLPTALRKGNTILVMDLGCGTADLVLYELLEDLSEQSRLDAISQSTGALCGSLEIDKHIESAILRSDQIVAKGGPERVAESLGLSHYAFRRRLLQAIAEAKLKYEGPMGSPEEFVVVKGASGYQAFTVRIKAYVSLEPQAQYRVC